MAGKIKEVLQTVKYGHIALCFCVPWWVFYFGRMVFFNPHNIPWGGKFAVYNALFPAILFFVIGFTGTCARRVTQKYSLAALVTWSVLLIIIDHTVKIGILQYFGKSNIPVFNYTPGEAQSFSPSIPLIGDWLLIQTYLNTRYFLYSQNLFIRGIFDFLCIPVLFLVVFRYLVFMKRDRWFTTLGFIFLLSAAICAFVDMAVYGGTYDYIRLTQFGALDLKDCYVFMGLGFLLLADIYDYKNLSAVVKYLFAQRSAGFARHEWQSLKTWLSRRIFIKRDK
jgi:lipoprotein signal peptidase